MKHGILYSALIIIGIGIIVGIFFFVGPAAIFANLQKIGIVGFLAFFGATLVVIALPIIGLQLILHSHNIKTKIWHTAIGQFIGNAIGFITPSLYLGGEPFKALYLGDLYKTSKSKIFSVAMFGKFQELSCLLFFVYVGTLIMIVKAEELSLPSGLWTILLIVDVGLGILVFFAIRSIIKNSPVLSNVALWIARRGIFRKRIEKIVPQIIELEEMIYQAFKHDWKTGLIAYGFSFLSILVAFLKPAVFFIFLSGGSEILPLYELAMIFTLTQILLVFHITPGCIGVFEGGQMGIFKIIGIDDGVAVAYLLIYRFVDLLTTGAGVYLAIHYGLVKFVGKRLEPLKDIQLNNGNENKPSA